jgi:4-hydroxy-tetrahydrodipicolinate reductase
MIKVIVNGAYGRMGKEACYAIENHAGLILVDRLGKDDDLKSSIKTHSADVVVDLTKASVGLANTLTILEAGARPVIGTSGFSSVEVEQCIKMATAKGLGGIIVPNFSIGAVMMMHLSKLAARYFDHVEIQEMHHSGKEEAPSGTAIKTAEMIASAQKIAQVKCHETLHGARGAVHQGVHIHSIRLPGYVAHQSVIFGGQSETLTIHHDSIHRQAFMPGLILACTKVKELNTMVYGLEHLLDLS